MFTVSESYIISGLTLSITQLTTFYRKMMSRGGGSGRGRPHKLLGVVAPSKVKRICGAEGCGVQVVGTELRSPPQPKIPLKMQILSQNAIFVTEKVNFYPNN